MALSVSGSQVVQWHKTTYGNSSDKYCTKQSEIKILATDSKSSPSICAKLNWELKRDSENNSTVKVKFSGIMIALCGSGDNRNPYTGNGNQAYYGYNAVLSMYIGGHKDETLTEVINKPASASQWTSDGYGKSTTEKSFTYASNDQLEIYLKVNADCLNNNKYCSDSSFERLVLKIDPPTYNNFTPPKIKINNAGTWGKKGYRIGDEISVNYTVTKGSHEIQYSEVKAYLNKNNYGDKWWENNIWETGTLFDNKERNIYYKNTCNYSKWF